MATQKKPRYGCIHLYEKNGIKLSNFTDEQGVVVAINAALSRCWTPGIKYQGGSEMGYDWKLGGHPWYGFKAEGIMSRRLIAALLFEMSKIGWHVVTAACLTRRQNDKDSLFFKLGTPLGRLYFPVAFSRGEKMRIIDAPNRQVTEVLLRVAQSYPLGISRQTERIPGVLNITFKGRPFNASTSEIFASRQLTCEILSELDSLGFELVVSINHVTGQGTRTTYNGDVDTWYFGVKQ